jgi:hypothetical protein
VTVVDVRNWPARRLCVAEIQRMGRWNDRAIGSEVCENLVSEMADEKYFVINADL